MKDSHSTQGRDDLLRFLDLLEDRLNADEQQEIRQRHMRAGLWEDVDRPPVRITPPWDRRSVQFHPVSEAVANPAKMLVNELLRGHASVLDWLTVKDDRPLQVRPDFGIGLVASTFGARIEVVDDNPPWVHSLTESGVEETIERVLDACAPSTSHERGWIPRVIETLDFYRQALNDYPNATASIAVAMPDLQGPFDTGEMLWGSGIFLALHANPALVDRFLGAIAEAMVHLHTVLRRWVGRELLPEGFSHQHGMMIRGNLMLRCDSNLMMHPEMYADQVLPHDRRVLEGVGGGSYHSCGRWEQNIPAIMEVDAVGSLDFGTNQSQLNDIDAIYLRARPYKKHLHLVTVTPEELTSGCIRSRFPTGVTLACQVGSVDDAAYLMRQYAGQQWQSSR